MKKFSTLLSGLFILMITITSCGNDEVNQIANAKSNICSNVTGSEAIYWDLENGIARTDLPGGIPPQVDNIGGTFSHQDFPLLGFNYPVGWTPEQLRGNGTVGVNLMRTSGGQGIWRYVGYSVGNSATARQVRDAEINAFMSFFGLGTSYDMVCSNANISTVASGINISVDNIMLRAGGMTGVVIVSVTFGSSIPIPQANVKVAVAPTNEFSDQIWDTFLAVEWQLLFGNPDTLYDGDSDNDGTPDIYDNFPNDPTRA
ncbi:MAG: hypothetical protein R2753_09845 [Chitinophagales bacterium]